MLINILTFFHGAFVLAFGIILSATFSKVALTKQNAPLLLKFFALSGCLQLFVIFTLSEAWVWKMYPFITHLPMILLLIFSFHKPLATALASTTTAYLFCQPSKWFGVLAYYLTKSESVALFVRILCLISFAFFAISRLSPYFSDVFCKDTRSVYIFAIVPLVYYIFDYITGVYTGLWLRNNRIVIEFLPFFLSGVYMLFCFIYYKEYEQKADAQRREQIIQIAVEQQTKEMTKTRQIEQELRLLRHDMRLLLSSLVVAIENGESETAQKMIDAYIDRIEGTRLERFCDNDIVNYVFSDYAARYRNESIPFTFKIELQELPVDEIMFCSILSNALDNALNAQKKLPPEKRYIKLTLRNSRGKLLLSVENPVGQKVFIRDGSPIATEKGHGYGTQSIQYLTDRLGGNCQFSAQGDTFILRVVL